MRWGFLLGVFKFKRWISAWFGTRRLDYGNLRITTQNIREYETRANSAQKEPDTVKWIEKYKGVFYDIGANIGAYSLIASSLGRVVYAFEPLHENIATLFRNNQLNGLSVCLVPFMVGETCVRRFSVPEQSGASVGLYGRSDGDTAFFSMGLDEYIDTFHLPSPETIKIDVDGGEIEVLQSAKQTLKRETLKSVLVESSISNAPEVSRFLKDFTLIKTVRMDARTVNLIYERQS